jgi:biotin synthase-related radical SAM superfamily protein
MLDKKKVLESILKDMEKKGGSIEVEVGEPEKEEDMPEMELEVAAEDILDALDRKDAGKLVAALKAFIEMC